MKSWVQGPIFSALSLFLFVCLRTLQTEEKPESAGVGVGAIKDAILPVLQDFLTHDDELVQAAASEGFAKLLLFDRIQDVQTLSLLIIQFHNPNSAGVRANRAMVITWHKRVSHQQGRLSRTRTHMSM